MIAVSDSCHVVILSFLCLCLISGLYDDCCLVRKRMFFACKFFPLFCMVFMLLL